MKTVIPCTPGAIPPKLREYSQWIVWKLLPPEKPGGKARKVPYNPTTGAEAKAGRPDTWGTYNEAVRAMASGHYDLIGFEFHTTDPFLGLDLDACRDPQTGAITPEAAAYIALAETYAEVSQSGTGIKLIAEASKVGTRCRRGGLEMYDQGRGFALTGCHLEGTPKTIEARQEECAGLYRAWFPAEEKAVARAAPVAPRLDLLPGGKLTDEQIRDIAFHARNGGEIQRLYNGDLCGKPTASEARAKMMYLLLFYTQSRHGGGPAQLERLMRSSHCDQTKWEELRGDQTFIAYECKRISAKYPGKTFDPQGNPPDQTTAPVKQTVQTVDMETGEVMETEVEPEAQNVSFPVSVLVPALNGRLKGKATAHAIGLVLEGELSLDQFRKIGKDLSGYREKTRDWFCWLLGDWYRALVTRHGQRKAEVTAWLGKGGYEQARQAGRVCGYWPRDRRRIDFPFWLHKVTAGYPDKQDHIFAEYDSKRFKKGESLTRERVREMLGLPPTQKRAPEKNQTSQPETGSFLGRFHFPMGLLDGLERVKEVRGGIWLQQQLQEIVKRGLNPEDDEHPPDAKNGRFEKGNCVPGHNLNPLDGESELPF